MTYVGNPIDTQNTFQSLQGKRFSGDGSTTAFTLDVAPSSTLDIEVFVGNVRQDPNSAYTLSGTTLTFTGAPPSGTNNIYVVHQAKSVGTIDVPASFTSQAQTFSGGLTSSGTTTVSGALNATGGLDSRGGAVFNEGSADEDFRVESNGNANMLFLDGGNNRVILGSATSVAPMSLEGALQVTGNSVNAMSLNRFTADEGGFDLIFLSSRNATPGSNTIVQDNDELGALHFCADDGTDYASKGAKISAKVNGTPGANDIPTELIFATTADGANSPTDRLTISAAGAVNVLSRAIIGDDGDSSYGLNIVRGGNAGENGVFFNDKDGQSSYEFFTFRRQGTQIGFIRRDGTNDAVTYNTGSDYRLKDGIVDKTDGIEKLKLLKPRKFYWKSNPDKTLVDGFVAHEVSDIVPEAISGAKDATETYKDENGDDQTRILPQGIDQSKLVPLLTAALKEAVTKIEALEARVTTLEG